MTTERKDTSAALDLDAIEALCSKITQGKWRWFGNLKSHNLYLATERRGRQCVMGFRRWGMGSAQPVFQSGGLLHTIPELADLGEITAKDYGSHEVLSVQHPDMQLMEQASTLVPQLLAEVRALREDAARLDWLDAQVRHPHYWHDVMACWDHEDGVWLQTVRKGEVSGDEVVSGYKHTKDIRAALDAARRGAA